MKAWEWTAGPRSGISGEQRRARRHAAAALRCGAADRAVLQMVTVVTGTATMNDVYVPVAGARAEGHRDGRGIRWDGSA